jgi:hypothetical protein
MMASRRILNYLRRCVGRLTKKTFQKEIKETREANK